MKDCHTIPLTNRRYSISAPLIGASCLWVYVLEVCGAFGWRISAADRQDAYDVHKLLNDLLFRDPLADQFESALKLRVMTFDTCQGEERDLIIFSMVAGPTRVVLNYVFPPNLDGAANQAEEKLKYNASTSAFPAPRKVFCSCSPRL